MEGDTDVPTDVVPYYETPTGFVGVPGVPGVFTLTSADGNAVPLSVRRLDSGSELTPASPLEPSMGYALAVTFAGGLDILSWSTEVHFTTGAGPLAEEPASPIAHLQHYRLIDGQGSGCQPPVGSCIALADSAASIEATYIDELDQKRAIYVFRGSAFGENLSGVGEDPRRDYRCVKLQTRAINGQLSDPVKLCGGDYPMVEVHGTDQVHCTSAGLMAGAASQARTTSGCTAVPRARGSTFALLPFLPLFIAARTRRTRRMP